VDIFEVVGGKAIAKEAGECIECCACVFACPNDAIEHSSC
jgi:NAD-dependent dihydropyrimidine dehydrogenase PreA subunit